MAENAIVADGLTKRFGAVLALDKVSFGVPAGTVFGLLGPNGSGKTTAVRILTTLLRPDAGRATVFGLDVIRDAAAVRRRIGLAGQSAAVDEHLTGRENLRLIGRLAQLPRAVFRPRTDALLERFGLADAASRPVRGYSGGMRRRLDVAAALVARPPVLFLDEPTTGLDLPSRGELWDVVRELVDEGTTVVLTTQYLEEADRLAGRVAVVDRGRVIANDTPAALKATLGSTVIEFVMPSGDGAASAARILAPVAGSAGAAPELDGSRVRLTAGDGSALLVDSLHALEVSGLRPAGVQVREPTMDDVFLLLTGHHVEEGPVDGRVGPDTPASAAAERRAAA